MKVVKLGPRSISKFKIAKCGTRGRFDVEFGSIMRLDIEYELNFTGGTVSARSVKLLDRISNPEEPETRDAWWTELRIEIKSHMRALACNAVLNYAESTSIW